MVVSVSTIDATEGNMYLVMTKVVLKPDSIDACVKLFEETNPDLVRNQPHWLGAQMAVDRAANTVTVLATWECAESYMEFSSSDQFTSTMVKFAALFAAPPDVSINEVIVNMSPGDL
jgi:quinol monooxygenase YgiN